MNDLKISSYLDTILKPNVEKLSSYVKDTSDFIRKIQNVKNISKESFLVTLDVSSLYTNIPHDEGIKTCSETLRAFKTPAEIQSLSKLLELVLTKNNFQFGDDNYLQVLGTAMGTKMAPSYASIFMGQLEKHLLGTCDYKPVLWLRFLDDIFLIWNHSEEKLVEFLENINTFHDSIKFTYNYSREQATFLDVNIKKNTEGDLITSVHEKSTNCHQYVEFSSCHPLSCKSGIPFSQAKRYRRITSDADKFIEDTDNLRKYFQERNYPDNIIDDAIKKVSSISMEEALQPVSTKDSKKDVIPFVCTYNPALPNIGKIVNQYWGLLKFSQSDSVKAIHKAKPIIAYKRPTNIQDILVHSAMKKPVCNGYVSKCGRIRCTHCKYITETDTFSSTTNSSNFNVKTSLTCSSQGVIYLISCKKCQKQYVGQTQKKCSVRMNSHRFDIKHHPDSYTNVSEHFNSSDHSINDFSFMPIDSVSNNWQRLLKETKWMYLLGTISPNGMNSKVLF